MLQQLRLVFARDADHVHVRGPLAGVHPISCQAQAADGAQLNCAFPSSPEQNSKMAQPWGLYRFHCTAPARTFAPGFSLGICRILADCLLPKAQYRDGRSAGTVLMYYSVTPALRRVTMISLS